jgi:tetratricopeptide (TPR) repeat protein
MKNRSNFCDQEQLSEIDGYLELGMEEEAISLIRVTLGKKDISVEEFNACVFALLQIDRPEPWRNAVETAYARLKKPVNDRIRSVMLNYYFSIGESEKAFEFFPKAGWTKFFDLWVMMQVCLELFRLDEAKRIARLCSRLLATAKDHFTKASMTDALATYYLRIGECESALKLWRQAPAEPAFERQRLCGLVKVHLLQALQAAKAGLATIATSQQHPDLSSEIQLPSHTSTLISDTERELKDLERAIERLIPETEQTALRDPEVGRLKIRCDPNLPPAPSIL